MVSQTFRGTEGKSEVGNCIKLNLKFQLTFLRVENVPIWMYRFLFTIPFVNSFIPMMKEPGPLSKIIFQILFNFHSGQLRM